MTQRSGEWTNDTGYWPPFAGYHELNAQTHALMSVLSMAQVTFGDAAGQSNRTLHVHFPPPCFYLECSFLPRPPPSLAPGPWPSTCPSPLCLLAACPVQCSAKPVLQPRHDLASRTQQQQQQQQQ